MASSEGAFLKQAPNGRFFKEILRVLDSLQLTAGYLAATAVNWHENDDVIIVTAASDADTKENLPKGFRAVDELSRRPGTL